MAIYAFTPHLFALVVVASVEWLRLRRPELNAWFLQKFSDIHRPSEVMKPSGIVWTLLGTWLTIVIFTNKRIVLPALGFLVFGDTAAAIGGKAWGKHSWSSDPAKTWEGSACFFVVSAMWALFFLRWPVAIAGALSGAWIESRSYRWNDNFWIPVLSGATLSVLNLGMGR